MFCLVACGFINANLISADVIWEPDDDFYQKHRNECVYEHRSYTVNSAKGYITSYVSPISSAEIRDIENGEELYVYYTYIDRSNKKWGLITEDTRNPGIYNSTSWVRMDEVKLVYDHQEFCKDHESEFKPLDQYLENRGEYVDVVLWSYPNSGVVTSSIRSFPMGSNMTYLYIDEYGRAWSYVYYYQCNRGWICLDDPNNRNLGVPTPTPAPTPVVKALSCEFKMVNAWPGGFIGQITITNNTNKNIQHWEANFTSEYPINSLWGANLVSSEGGKYMVTSNTWDEALKPSETRSFNFVAQNDYAKPIDTMEAHIVD